MISNLHRLYFTILLLISSTTVQGQIKIFVADQGNDHNNGSISSPLRTLAAAVHKAYGVKDKNVSIALRGGTYYLDKPLVITSTDLKASALQIEGFKSERVVISAGTRLKLNWEPWKPGMYKADVSSDLQFECLYVNNNKQVLARYPNYDPTARVYHGAAADAISPERVKTWKNVAGGYVHALHGSEWGSMDYIIKGADGEGNLALDGGWQINRQAPMHKTKRFVENIMEELDAPGEWCLDRVKHQLYYYPPQGVDLTTATIEVSRFKNAIELRGTLQRPLKKVTINNLSFSHTERSFMETKEPLLRSDWAIYRGGAILLNGTENCVIRNCNFTGLGGNAIMVSNYNKADLITRCLIADIGASAICFVGDPKAARSPLFNYNDGNTYNQLDKVPGPITENYPRECTVTDNLIHNIGEIEKQSAGVEIDIASTIIVTHNSIYDTPRAGINIGDGCWGGHVLAYNDVFNTVLETGDNGAFNSWGRDRYWHPDRNYMDSVVAVHPEIILLDAQKTNVIHDNRFRCDHGWDIDLDDGSTNYHIYNNICLNGGIKLREGFFRTVENNIILNNSFHAHVWFNNSGDVFQHNIVTKKYFPIRVKQWGPHIDNNLFPDSAALVFAHLSGTDQHSVAGTPSFTNAKNGNYTISNAAQAASIGFHNIPVDEFGVQYPSLKKLAHTAPIPVLLTTKDLKDKTTLIPFLGGTLKNVDGLGDRSVYGLPDEKGVIVVTTGKGPLLLSGLKEKDVVVTIESKAVVNIAAFVSLIQENNWKGKMAIGVIRDQQTIKLILNLR